MGLNKPQRPRLPSLRSSRQGPRHAQRGAERTPAARSIGRLEQQRPQTLVLGLRAAHFCGLQGLGITDSSPKRLSSSQTQGPTFNREKRVLLLVLLSEELLGVKDPIPPPLLMSEDRSGLTALSLLSHLGVSSLSAFLLCYLAEDKAVQGSCELFSLLQDERAEGDWLTSPPADSFSGLELAHCPGLWGPPDWAPAHDLQDTERSQKRVRTMFNLEQLEELEKMFAKQHNLVGKQRAQLAAQLNLTENQVRVWFQNRRVKYQKQQRLKLPPVSATAASPDEPSSSSETSIQREDAGPGMDS
uniref:Homeobox protein notochord n=1 Tax=Camelus bactrianus TaxID=9837 RepID=A0A9W3GHR2_CAMBA|nr:homeobox protein notochord [Camelus bactrianus]